MINYSVSHTLCTYVEFLGLTLEDFDPFFTIFKPIADYLNLDYAWRREGDQLTTTFTPLP